MNRPPIHQRKRKLSTFLHSSFLFGLGWTVGRIQVRIMPLSSSSSHGHPSSIHRLQDTPSRPTSHTGITKQQFIEPFVQIPTVAGVSVATVHPGQDVAEHSHRSMHEFFYILEGQGTFRISNKKEVTVTPGTFLHITPHEAHAIHVSDSMDEDLVFLVTGIIEE